MAIAAARAIRRANPDLPIVLGGISPIDPNFLQLMGSYGVLDHVDVVALHGFPLDWNHWSIHDWPKRIDEIRGVTNKPIWVSEAGASSFGAEEVQLFGLQRTAELLLPLVERVHWYSLFDLPATWTATTRHKESEGSAYYRHYYMGLLREDGSPKLAASVFPERMGICGISWADSFRPNAEIWFDRQMNALAEFDTTLTLCFTPEHLGLVPHYTSPPKDPQNFAEFAVWAVNRYAPPMRMENSIATALVGERVHAGAQNR
jgi:beta-xylosidase